ncbi:uncharacterized protein EDB91DRAFT_1076291 [Suillus paluster]|uniref:uncharacterized protein n=1 Tax=Suillus paluster TaxID=48578 RepID=UPI001B883D85|nr:uncharacterized protein EDB91DRAFT_1076291 [Suillus paluster]KAG1756190.1 hypothetical protein EDB91DRAFT_1076291 [Suillus paluster]
MSRKLQSSVLCALLAAKYFIFADEETLQDMYGLGPEMFDVKNPHLTKHEHKALKQYNILEEKGDSPMAAGGAVLTKWFKIDNVWEGLDSSPLHLIQDMPGDNFPNIHDADDIKEDVIQAIFIYWIIFQWMPLCMERHLSVWRGMLLLYFKKLYMMGSLPPLSVHERVSGLYMPGWVLAGFVFAFSCLSDDVLVPGDPLTKASEAQGSQESASLAIMHYCHFLRCRLKMRDEQALQLSQSLGMQNKRHQRDVGCP